MRAFETKDYTLPQCNLLRMWDVVAVFVDHEQSFRLCNGRALVTATRGYQDNRYLCHLRKMMHIDSTSSPSTPYHSLFIFFCHWKKVATGSKNESGEIFQTNGGNKKIRLVFNVLAVISKLRR